MSDKTRIKIAVLQHKRRQAAAREALLRASERLGEPGHEPVEPDVSLRLQTDLYALVKTMRGRGNLRRSEFRDADSALSAAEENLERLGKGAVFEVYAGASGSGFFVGPVSGAFLSACLLNELEGFAVVLPDLESGLLLDVVHDDPVRGSFYEVEWW